MGSPQCEHQYIKTIYYDATHWHQLVSSLPWISPSYCQYMIPHPSIVPYCYVSLCHCCFSTQADANFFSNKYNNVKEIIASYNLLFPEKRKRSCSTYGIPWLGCFAAGGILRCFLLMPVIQHTQLREPFWLFLQVWMPMALVYCSFYSMHFF